VDEIEDLFENALNGDLAAQANLGLIYLKRDTGPQDFQQGKYWLEKAARRGDTRALRVLATCFQFGHYGFPQNQDIANHWWYMHHRQLKNRADAGDNDAERAMKLLSDIAKEDRFK